MRIFRSVGATTTSTPLSAPFLPMPHALNSLFAYSSTSIPSSESTVTTAISAVVSFSTARSRSFSFCCVPAPMMCELSLTYFCGGGNAACTVATAASTLSERSSTLCEASRTLGIIVMCEECTAGCGVVVYNPALWRSDMKATTLIFGGATVALLSTPFAMQPSAQTPDPRVAEAVRPLPDDLQAGATVVVYEQKTGERKVLRQGTNMVECQPKNPVDGFTRCYHKMLAPRRDLEAKLRAQGKKDEEVSAAVADALKAGTLKAPPFGTMSYRLSDEKGR